MARIIVTAYPFGTTDVVRRQLAPYDWKHATADMGREPNELELRGLLAEHRPEVVIAGTEPYSAETLHDAACYLRLISRVGIGVDSVDLESARLNEIDVTNTPDAPSNAVAELVICQIINCLRQSQVADRNMRSGRWRRHIGRSLRECDVGLIGCGRVGKLVIEKMQGLKPRRIFVNDILPERMRSLPRCEPESRAQIFASCDVVSISIPLNDRNRGYVGERELNLMRPDAVLINTSRGPIVDEHALFDWLHDNPDASAAVDVFGEEPYSGPLIGLPNAYLTPHLGSCTEKSRFDMEVGAAEEALNYLHGRAYSNPVVAGGKARRQ